MEILHEIVSTEHTAREEYEEVIRRREGFGSYLENKTQEMRREYFARADEAIAKVEKTETEKADAQIAALDKTLESEMSIQRRRYEGSKDALAQRLFDLVVGRDGDT